MKKICLSLLLLCTAIICCTGCKKSSNNSNTYTPSAFADSLRNMCTMPFIGPGDSSSFYLPTAFTPNADGRDDLYLILGKDLNFTSFLLTVYDTTGKLVFQSNNASYRWDGHDTATGKLSTQYKFYVEVKYTTTGNKSAGAGTYVYLLSGNEAAECVNIVHADSSKYEFPDQFNLYTGEGFDPAFLSGENFCN